MRRCLPLLITSGVALFHLPGCAGDPSLPGQIAAESREVEPVPHPLSYQSIQLAAHSEEQSVVEVGFNHRYDVFCVLFPDVPMVYRNCRIVGVTGHTEFGGKSYVLLSPSSSLGCGFGGPSGLFDDMLLLETEDGRLAYIPPGAVKYIEESASSRHPIGNSAESLPRN